MLFCRWHAIAEMKEESGFSATELYYLSMTAYPVFNSSLFYNTAVTNCKLLQTDLALQLNGTKS